MSNISISHCGGQYLREFAHKTVSGIDVPNKDGYLPELRRLRYRPIGSDAQLNVMVKKYSNRPGEYISVYPFEKTDTDGRIIYDTAKINRIYFDFDCKEDPQKAINEALMTSRSLLKHGIFTHCYFSGSKGIALYIEFTTTDIKPENKKDVIGSFFDMVKDTVRSDFEYELLTLDTQVRGDIARVSRIPNTKHANGLYCIPINFEDMDKGVDHIRSLAKEPRDIDLESVITMNTERNIKMPTIIKNLEKQVIANKDNEKIAAQLQHKYYENIKKRYPVRGGRITDEDINKAKSVSVSSIISKDKKIVCPFHADGEPSLSIDHKKGLWYCFGCGKGGDVITFVMEKYNLNFKEAVLQLQSS